MEYESGALPSIGGTSSLLPVLVVLVFMCCMLCNLYLSIQKNLNLKVLHLLFPLLAFNCIYLGLLTWCPVSEVSTERMQTQRHSMLLHLCASQTVLKDFTQLLGLQCGCLYSNRCYSIGSLTSSQNKSYRYSDNPCQRKNSKPSVKWLFMDCWNYSFFINLAFYFRDNYFNFQHKEVLKVLSSYLHSYTTDIRAMAEKLHFPDWLNGKGSALHPQMWLPYMELYSQKNDRLSNWFVKCDSSFSKGTYQHYLQF